jgi:hypothetical protein
MKHLSLLFRFVLVSLVVLCGAVGVAHAAPAVAVYKCRIYACDSALSLKNEARLAGYSLPLGSIVFVSSEHYPLSAFARMCTGARGARDACLITAGDYGAIELDNEVYARATAIEPIDIPPETAPSATQAIYELVQGYIYDPYRLIATGRNGINPWHDLFNPLAWPWMEIYDWRSNANNTVYAGDRITVRFADGSTAQLEMVGLGAPSGHFFVWVAGSERDSNGNPFTSEPIGSAAPASGGFDLLAPWLDSSFSTQLIAGLCAFLESTCEWVNPYEVNCYYRRKDLPCG